MTEQMAIEYMKNEVMCIEKASHCDRDCLKCELVKEERPLLESFATAIKALEEIQQYRAIEIVNKVAEEYKQEVCEWKEDDKFSWHLKSPHEHLSIVDAEKILYKYYPYCGKKIKVIE